MASKRDSKKGKSVKNDRPDEKEEDRADSTDNSPIEELEYTHIPTYENGKTGPEERYTLNRLKDFLGKLQEDQPQKEENINKQLREWCSIPYLAADLAAKAQPYEAAKHAEAQLNPSGKATGKSQAAKLAKVPWEKADKALKKAKKIDPLKLRDERNNAHDDRRRAEARLEDFLYFQEENRRRLRRGVINPSRRVEAEAERMRRGKSYKLDTNGADFGHFDWLHTTLEYFDSRGIGNIDYAHGRTDRLGNTITEEDRLFPPRLGPQDLHMWTPLWRRDPVGLSRHVNYGGNDELEPMVFDLDLAAIETERLKHDGEEYSMRRIQQRDAYGRVRPNTSNIQMQGSGESRTAHDRWREIQTDQGLFIAAKETSWDWLTSYDCLDRVGRHDQPIIIPTSAVRDLQPPDPNDGDGEDDMIKEPDYDANLVKDLPGDSPSGDGNKSREISQPALEESATSKDESEGAADDQAEKPSNVQPPPSGSKRKPDASEPETRGKRKNVKVAASKRGGKASKASTKATGEDDWKKRRANIDYPYPRNEFARPKKEAEERPADSEDTFTITPWVEETDGRREWHAYRQLTPSSDVCSPPRSPIWPDRDGDVTIDQASLPHADEDSDNGKLWRTLPDSAMPNLEQRQQQCSHDTKCRAWWSHQAAECWVVHSEQAPHRSGPKGLETPLVMAASGVSTYRARLYDHYGTLQPTDQKERWPKLGIRVPYEPMTFDDRKLAPRTDAEMENIEGTDGRATDITMSGRPEPKDKADKDTRGFFANDSESRTAHEIMSMAVPIIKTPHRDWGEVGAEPPPGSWREHRPKLAEESEEEGDLFHESYKESSRPANQVVPES